MTVATRAAGGILIVSPEGEADLENAPTLAAALAQADTSARIVVDLSGVSFADSSAMAVLVELANRARGGGGALHLAAPRPHVRRVLEMTRLTLVLPTFDAVAEAVAAFGSGDNRP